MRAVAPIVAAALVLAGCASGREAGSATPSALASRPSAQPSPSAAPAPTELPPVGELLPRDLDGVELHTFPVATDLLARLADGAGVAVDELEVAYASEHGARFVQMLAVRAPAVPAARLLELFPVAAYGPEATPERSVRTESLAGEEVIVVEDPALVPRLGIFHGLVRGDSLIVVQAFSTADAEAAISALPDR